MSEGLKVRNVTKFAVIYHIDAEYRKDFKVSTEVSMLQGVYQKPRWMEEGNTRLELEVLSVSQ